MSSQREPFDAKSARTRQPLPLWVGAFDRATDEMTHEHVGAYMLILMAMWRSKSCDLPEDEKYLARVVRVSPTTWRRKFAPVLMPMLSHRNGRIFSEKLEEIAGKTEEFCQSQFDKKTGKKSDKALKQNKVGASGDEPEKNPGQSPEEPKPITLNKKEEEGVRASARAFGFSEGGPDPLLRRVTEAVGLSGVELSRFWLGDQAATHVRAWLTAHGLTEDEVVAEAARSRVKNPDPPDGPKALDRWMEQAGVAKREAGKVKGREPAAAAADKPSVKPEDRLKFFADWLNDPARHVPSNLIGNTLRDALLASGMVTQETMRSRGIR